LDREDYHWITYYIRIRSKQNRNRLMAARQFKIFWSKEEFFISSCRWIISLFLHVNIGLQLLIQLLVSFI
jgi:hypothetical protein